MPDAISALEFKQLRDLIEKLSGISLGEEKAYLVETRLAGLLAENGCADFGAFCRMAANDHSPQLRDKIVDAMTTNETLWFRDTHPFTILQEKLLPALAEELARGSRYRIRVWSGACSTGQEPYSLAMAIQEFCRLRPALKPEQFEILATDISPSALLVAKMGRYDQAAIARGLPDQLRDRYFRREGNVWIVDDQIKRMVTFRKFNLQDAMDPLGHFDIVFLRYVAIYFSDAFKQMIYRGIAELLTPKGHLLISAVESLRGISEDFDQLNHGGGTYYQCRFS
ncbi:MAG TPA: protein-glutamate O-methyltransferase CheR [Holophaga sp.]|nr:protein-glutamate O-methyltransferase CheR [Holophaga sp.]